MNQPMKGIILAGGTGTRLLPLTSVTCKQLLPVYDRPMIFYPLNTLIKAGIRDILVIVSPEYSGQFLNLLGSMFQSFGIQMSFVVQKAPRGLTEAFVISSMAVLRRSSWGITSSKMISPRRSGASLRAGGSSLGVYRIRNVSVWWNSMNGSAWSRSRRNRPYPRAHTRFPGYIYSMGRRRRSPRRSNRRHAASMRLRTCTGIT